MLIVGSIQRQKNKRIKEVKVYRIQDSEGRGPFRPGFSHIWRDERGEDFPPWYAEMPEVLAKLQGEQQFAIGTGCKSHEQLRKWFTEDEYYRLVLLGYSAVELDADKTYGESENQCVFGRRKLLRNGARKFALYDEAAQT